MNPELYDIHTHSGVQKNNLFEENAKDLRVLSIPELVAAYEDRIDKIVNFPMPGTVYFNYEDRTVNSSGGSYPFEIENLELLRAVEKHDKKGKILPFLCVDPTTKVAEQAEGLYKLLKDHKIFGLKFHTLDTHAGVEDLFASSEIIALCREFGLPMIIHSGDYNNEEDCSNIFEYAEENRDLNFCIAHLMTFSRVFFEKMKKYKHGNVFTDVSPFLGLCEYVRTLRPEGSMDLEYHNPARVIKALFRDFSDVILWGSDEPFGNFKIDDQRSVHYSLREEVDFLFSLEEDIRMKIASINSEKFLFGSKNS